MSIKLQLGKILKNLNNQVSQIQGNTRVGLLESSINILGESLKRTPIDTGTLRNSAYIRDINDKLLVAGEQSGIVRKRSSKLNTDSLTIGYRTKYALLVHEINKNYKAPGTSWKFLAIAINENFKTILEIIKRRAKIKP